LGTAIVPITLATDVNRIKGIDKGPSYLPVVALKKTTMVNFDEDTYLDDYAYLAAVPTAVFQSDGKLFSYPLLFYQDEYPVEDDKERSLDARAGIDYFMEDWMSYSNGRLDKMTLINVPMNKLDSTWKAKEYDMIESESPYDIAASLALNEWSYSDDAVIAVIEESFEKPDNVTSSTVEGTIPGGKEIIQKTFYTDQLDKLNPRFHEFDVPDGYKYLKSRTWWASLAVGTGKESALPLHINIAIPAADPDSQLYCKYDDKWMQVAVTQGWNIGGMDKERAETYVYTSGQWRLGITDVPTFKIVERYGSLIDIIRNMIRGARYQTDITIFPGVEQDLPVDPPFGCRDANFKLTWDASNVHLGFSLIGPAGEEILSASDEENDYQEMHLDQLGECLPDENYAISVFRLDDVSQPIDFEVEFSWSQNFSKEQANSLTSATEGSVLASILNAPLLYADASGLTESTKNVLYKLGVESVYLVSLGEHLSDDVEQQIADIATIQETYIEPGELYEEIMELTGRNDVIISTIDPWTQWLVTERKPADETKASLFIGPAAYTAAHHGSPVIIIDNHPELSSAVVWHNEFWKRNAKGYKDLPIAQMHLTGSRVINFLKDHGFDKEGKETMITIAGQYDIGAPWDRAFVGKMKPGRLFGSPVDTAYWTARNVFYPALIFENPAMNPQGNTLIQGSYSERRNILPWGGSSLKITKPSQEETFEYPVLQMYICYDHKLNERFQTYYGFQYKCADDIIPGVTESNEPIDEGSVPGKQGALWPDISGSEVIPFYLEKGGYDSVFSTSYSATIDNLNNGVLLWLSGTHGDSAGSGMLLTWDPEVSGFSMFPKILTNRLAYMKQENPWRGYEWYLGSTENPDTMTMEVHGFLPALLGNPNMQGLFPIGEDYWPSERPILHRLTNLPIIKWFMPGWLKNPDYYKDGLVGAHTITTLAASSTSLTGYTLDDGLENIHSCGWINTACLPAYNLMHLTMVRHGSVFQVIDPWPTSWYGSFWQQTIPRDIILGDTIGEAYEKGIRHVGILYNTEPPQWWWDVAENVCFFGDPDLRPFVPDTKYSDANYWTKGETEPLRYDSELDVDGHMPFGATGYPHEKEPLSFWLEYLAVIVGIIVIVIVLVAVVFYRKKKK